MDFRSALFWHFPVPATGGAVCGRAKALFTAIAARKSEVFMVAVVNGDGELSFDLVLAKTVLL